MAGNHVRHTVFGGIGFSHNHLFLRMDGEKAYEGYHSYGSDDGSQSGE
jgi:hypothetical protein